MNHPWVALPSPTHDTNTKTKSPSSTMNPLKLLSCIRSRSPAPFLDSPENEKCKADYQSSEGVTVIGNLDIDKPKKEHFLALSNSRSHSNATSTNTSAVGSPTHSSSALHTPPNQQLHFNKIDLNMPSPDRKTPSKGKGFFTSLYSAVRKKDNLNRGPDTPPTLHHKSN